MLLIVETAGLKSTIERFSLKLENKRRREKLLSSQLRPRGKASLSFTIFSPSHHAVLASLVTYVFKYKKDVGRIGRNDIFERSGV